MPRPGKLQLIGPLALALAVLAAETAAYALAIMPSSSLLWYLNLELFSLFRKSRAYLGELSGLPFAQLLLIAGPLAAIALAGFAARQKLLVAISTNLSFVYATFLGYCWFNWHSVGNLKAASLVWVQVPSSRDLPVFAILFVAALLSFVSSHVMYVADARRST